MIDLDGDKRFQIANLQSDTFLKRSALTKMGNYWTETENFSKIMEY